MIELAVIAVSVIVLACVIAWFMNRKETRNVPIREVRRREWKPPVSTDVPKREAWKPPVTPDIPKRETWKPTTAPEVERRETPEREMPLRRPAVLQKLLAPLTFEDAVITEVVETRKASGIFVVMKPELVEQLAVIAKDKRMSRSGLCRESIMRGLETVVKS